MKPPHLCSKPVMTWVLHHMPACILVSMPTILVHTGSQRLQSRDALDRACHSRPSECCARSVDLQTYELKPNFDPMQA